MPRKSLVRFALLSFASGEPAPKTWVMSLPLFSRTMLAVETAPKLQPALTYGTHGAGRTFPVESIISKGMTRAAFAGSGATRSVQYAKADVLYAPRLLLL